MLLAVDTSTPQIGVALYDGARVLAEHLWVSQSRHTVELAPMVEKMFQQTGLTVSDLSGLGVALGPGSFTSLRVGLSFVKGLAISRTLPLIGISTLEVIAAPVALDKRPLACLLPAGRGRLAVGWFQAEGNGWRAMGSPYISSAEEVSVSIKEPTLIAGDLTIAERSLLQNNPLIQLVSPALSTRRPGVLAELAWQRLQTGQTNPLHSLAPLYLHIGEPI
ncbi:MAG: tRNA (adenosine(37)-N6)-threonylcarbamoyltransferase complex dimerization subunit type 1 TsaB [Anaerolineae bacterium]|nr:MAG: tRNA (adenosine(37)-N6)-threonylcarbamoyltransferase complex dimerization subunit type 1 TsaB [Anaerolineae bacterium]